MWDDLYGPTAKQFFQPLLGGLSARFVQFRCVDAVEADALGSVPNGVTVDDVDLLITKGSRISCGQRLERGETGMFLRGSQFVSVFRQPVRTAVWRMGRAMGFESRQSIWSTIARRRIPAEVAVLLHG